MIVVVARYIGAPGTEPAVRAALERLAKLTQELEPGCLTYQVSQALEDPDEWLLYEVYRDEAAVDVHRSSAHFQEIVIETIVPLLKERTPRAYRLVIGAS